MRMSAALLLFALVCGMASADFLIERVDVTISDIQPDGSARVHESIKFVMYGNYSNSLYDSGIGNNELSFWSTNVGLKDIKFHTNPARVDILDLRLRPQPRTKCNPIEGICHGELILDYIAAPARKDNASTVPLAGTGLFTLDKYKPRTQRYNANPDALAFTTTSEGNIIMDKNTYLTLNLPAESVLLDVNPRPSDLSTPLPAHVANLSWTDSVLVKLTVSFEVEEDIDKEVSDFFSGIAHGVSEALSGPQGLALVALVVVVIGAYLYISMAKRRGEE